MEWADLHIRLAEMLGDPRDNSGVLLTTSTYNSDGVRNTFVYRNRLLNASLKWALTMFDPVYILQSAMPLGNRFIAKETVVTPSGTMSYKILKLLSTYYLDGSDYVTVPIVSTVEKRHRRYTHRHWKNTMVCYLSGQAIAFINAANGIEVDVEYLIDFADITTDSDIGIPPIFHESILHYALYLNKVNSQRTQEATYIGQGATQGIVTIKQTIEQTKQIYK